MKVEMETKPDRIERVRAEVLAALPESPTQFDGVFAMTVARDLYPEDTWERGFAPMLVLLAWVENASPDGTAPGLTAL